MKEMTVGPSAVEFKAGALHSQSMAENSRRCSYSSGGAGAAPFCGACSSLGSSPQGGTMYPVLPSSQGITAFRSNPKVGNSSFYLHASAFGKWYPG
jgi:hypothetical protein